MTGMRGRLFPRPRIALAAGASCRCPCHDRLQADALAAAQHRGEPRTRPSPINGIGGETVETRDATSAVLACDRCRDHHCPALSGDPAALDRAWWRWWPRAAPAPPAPVPGETYTFGGGDGPES